MSSFIYLLEESRRSITGEVYYYHSLISFISNEFLSSMAKNNIRLGESVWGRMNKVVSSIIILFHNLSIHMFS
jgi:hypothetical protein